MLVYVHYSVKQHCCRRYDVYFEYNHRKSPSAPIGTCEIKCIQWGQMIMYISWGHGQGVYSLGVPCISDGDILFGRIQGEYLHLMGTQAGRIQFGSSLYI